MGAFSCFLSWHRTGRVGNVTEIRSGPDKPCVIPFGGHSRRGFLIFRIQRWGQSVWLNGRVMGWVTIKNFTRRSQGEEKG